MKINLWIAVISSAFIGFPSLAQTTNPVSASAGQVQPPPAYQITQQGRHFRVWERTVNEPRPDGTIEPRKHSYTELRSFMNHPVNGGWVESSPVFLLTNGYATRSPMATIPRGACVI